MRVGIGHDTHRLEPGRPLLLGGVRVEHPRGLAGHSDADVVLHAVTDALLGAAGLGDIGDAYPDTDPAWHGADSALFLRETARAPEPRRLAGGQCGCDRLRPGAEARPRQGGRSAPASPACSALPQDAVNVKAKTGERVGHIGRAEAMACQAVVLIESY